MALGVTVVRVVGSLEGGDRQVLWHYGLGPEQQVLRLHGQPAGFDEVTARDDTEAEVEASSEDAEAVDDAAADDPTDDDPDEDLDDVGDDDGAADPGEEPTPTASCPRGRRTGR